MACFLGEESEIISVRLKPMSEWDEDFEIGWLRLRSVESELDSVRARLKRKDLAGARTHAAKGILRHMTPESAANKLEPEEYWADGSLELWHIDALVDSEKALRWRDLDPALYREGVGASSRLASLVYPRPGDWADENSQEAIALYLEACQWADELFNDGRVWQSVQTLAKELIRRREILEDDMLRIIDGKDKTLAYLKQLAASEKWRQRLEPPTPAKSGPKNGRKPMSRVTSGVKPGNN